MDGPPDRKLKIIYHEHGHMNNEKLNFSTLKIRLKVYSILPLQIQHDICVNAIDGPPVVTTDNEKYVVVRLKQNQVEAINQEAKHYLDTIGGFHDDVFNLTLALIRKTSLLETQLIEIYKDMNIQTKLNHLKGVQLEYYIVNNYPLRFQQRIVAGVVRRWMTNCISIRT